MADVREADTKYAPNGARVEVQDGDSAAQWRDELRGLIFLVDKSMSEQVGWTDWKVASPAQTLICWERREEGSSIRS